MHVIPYKSTLTKLPKPQKDVHRNHTRVHINYIHYIHVHTFIHAYIHTYTYVHTYI